MVLVAVAAALAVAAVVLVVLGIEVRETTGGLLVAPIRQLHLVGGYLLAGTAAGVAAVLTALVAVPALRSPQQAPATERTEEPAPSGEPASLAPGSERSS